MLSNANQSSSVNEISFPKIHKIHSSDKFALKMIEDPKKIIDDKQEVRVKVRLLC